MHGHAWNWDQHKRRPDGQFLSFPAPEKKKTDKDKKASISVRLLRLASLLPVSQEKTIHTLISLATDLNDGTLKIEE